jgi:hypothetical protein
LDIKANQEYLWIDDFSKNQNKIPIMTQEFLTQDSYINMIDIETYHQKKDFIHTTLLCKETNIITSDAKILENISAKSLLEI